MQTITRSERKVLRRLADVAYARELGQELTRLEAGFGEWRAGRLSPFALSDLIHRFHDGDARDLYAMYTRSHPEQIVARALAAGLLAPDEVPGDCGSKLAASVEFFRQEIALESQGVGSSAPEQ